jgi:glutamine amidotransferase
MIKPSVCILDYGSGNVTSVYNMVSHITQNVKVSNDEEAIKSSTHVILPGVGAFGASMEKIKNKIPLGILKREVLENKKPFLGICVGLQILADRGYEFGEYDGLGWIPGETIELDSKGAPLPHIGWNDIKIIKQTKLLDRLENDTHFYFVHTYVFKERNKEDVIATASYGTEFPAIVNRDNIYGVQFHPEKSQKTGMVLLENFLELA